MHQRAAAQPFFVGPPDAQLFAVLHSPPEALANGCGVLLLNPMGHEYIRNHRAYRHLAERLARNGFHALRFDFTGCGDSSGDDADMGITPWIEDMFRMVHELETRAAARKLYLVGRRLGGALALLVSQRREVNGLVLWDPVVEGRRYLQELEQDHERFVSGYHGRIMVSLRKRASTHGRRDDANEFLGQTISMAFSKELEELDLTAMLPTPGTDALWIDTEEKDGGSDYRARLEGVGAAFRFEQVPTPPAPFLDELLYQTVPNTVLQTITSWLGEVSR